MLLKDKVAIVSGGSRGIGRAIVLGLASNGADVAFNYLKSKDQAEEVKKEVELKGRKAIVFQSDVKDFEKTKEMIDKTREVLGGLDIVVNNAGILRDKALMLMELSDWEQVISTNLSGAFNLVRAAIVGFMKEKKGNIINITSIAGLKGAARQVNYSASKAGLIGLTKSLAKEVARYNIRVNAIAPGYIDTDMVSAFKESYKNELLKAIPLNRFGNSEEIARVASFLASEESGYITGQIIPVDGGLAM